MNLDRLSIDVSSLYGSIARAALKNFATSLVKSIAVMTDEVAVLI